MKEVSPMFTKVFYKVVALSIDVFESTIIDERHFGTRSEAEAYANSFSGSTVAIIVEM